MLNCENNIVISIEYMFLIKLTSVWIRPMGMNMPVRQRVQNAIDWEIVQQN